MPEGLHKKLTATHEDRFPHAMRFGFETVLWGRRIDDLDYALEVISRCGYQGVEFSQHPSQIFFA